MRGFSGANPDSGYDAHAQSAVTEANMRICTVRYAESRVVQLVTSAVALLRLAKYFGFVLRTL